MAIVSLVLRPLLVIEDIVVRGHGVVVLLPAVAREGLPVGPGDVLELCTEEDREEVTVVSVEPDRHAPSLVRIAVTGACHARPGVEVWPSETCSRVVVRRPISPGATMRR